MVNEITQPNKYSYETLIILVLILLQSAILLAQEEWDGNTSGVLHYTGGKVGIGTDNPTFNLDIIGDMRISENGNNPNYLLGYNGVNKFQIGYDYTDDILKISSRKDNGSWTQRFSIDKESGFIGIGSSIPTTTLEVFNTNLNQHSAIFNYTSNTLNASNTFGLNLINSDLTENAVGGIKYSLLDNEEIVRNAAWIATGKEGLWDESDLNTFNSFLVFGTRNGSNGIKESLRINSQGNIGIGTTNPTDKLDIHQGGIVLSRPNQGIGVNTDMNGLTWIVDDDSQGRVSEEAAAIKFLGSGTWNSTLSPAVLSFETLAAAGGGTVQRMVISSSGRVGIGVPNPDEKLVVDGTIKSEEVIVENVTGADYVFEEDYALPSLQDISDFVKTNKHLPEVPSAQAMEENGLNLGEMNILLLKKIEELTLHLIEQDMQNKKQQIKIEQLETLISQFINE